MGGEFSSINGFCLGDFEPTTQPANWLPIKLVSNHAGKTWLAKPSLMAFRGQIVIQDTPRDSRPRPVRRPAPKRARLAWATLVLLISASPLASGEPATQPPDPILAEFLAIAEGIEASDNTYLGTKQISALEQRLAQTNPQTHPAPVAALLGQLSFENLRLGKVDTGARHMETVFAMAKERQLPPTPLMHRLRVMVELRRAEVENCITRHNKDCCLFPLAAGGVHRDKAPARRARESLLAILAEKPDDLHAQWLLNLVTMAIGDHPEGVPEAFRLPPNSLTSGHELGRFLDVAPDLKVDAFNLCGGAVAEDFDNDGFLDLATSTSDPRGHLLLYRNTGDGAFEELSDVAGLHNQLGGLNLLGADYDNDGDVDLLVLRGAWMGSAGRIRNSLLRNDGQSDSGARITFTDVTHEAGLAAPAYPTQAAVWADLDNDGDLDLFVGNENDGSRDPTVGVYPSQLFRNNGNGTFTETAGSAGVRNDRMAKGVTIGDYDNDGDLDLYVSNLGANRLYRNDTPRTPGAAMTFTDVAMDLGVTKPAARSFAPWFFDVNNDGWLDLFVTAYDATTANLMLDYRGQPHRATPPCLYLNRGGKFEEVSKEFGLDHAYLPMGASFGDVDNDGFLDIYLATGDPGYETLMPNVMLRNNRGTSFQDVTTSGGFGHLQKGHGICFADFDHDGDQDLFHQLGGFFPGDKFHNALFRNPGNKHHHLAIELRGVASNRSAVGARIAVTLQTPTGSRTIHRAVGSVSSFGGSPVRRQEIGLGNATGIEELKVTWPRSKEPDLYRDVPLDTIIGITEGEPAISKP